MVRAPGAQGSGTSAEPAAYKVLVAKWGGLAALVVATAIVYSTTLDYEYSWDDELFLAHSPKLQKLSNLPLAFTVDFWGMTDTPTHPEGSPLYRPLALGLIILERSLFGDRGSSFRFFHMLIHLANIVLLYVFARKMLLGGASFRGPLLSAAALAALPYTVDTVLFLTCISDLTATSFTIAALICFLNWIDKGGPGYLMGLFVASVAAVLSKESAVMIPLILAAVYWGRREVPPRPRRAIAAFGLSLAVVVGFLILRAQVVDSISAALAVELFKWLPADLASAFRFAIAPFPLVLEQEVVRSWTGIEWWLGLLGIAAAVVFAVMRGRRHAVLLAGVAIWVISIIPSLAALQWTGVFAPRYLYLPTIGIALAIGYLASASSRLPGVLLSVLLLAAGFLTLSRTADWKDSVTLWAMEIGNRPKSTSALINLGNLLARRGDYEEALPLQLKAAKTAEEQNRPCSAAFAYSNAATIVTKRFGDDASGLKYFEKCVDLCPEKAQNAWIGIAGIHIRARGWAQAERAARKAEDLGTQKLKVY
jgi:tetratricopeptide (TPR) repeat protein